MNATVRFLVWGTLPLGGLLGGALGELLGVRAALVVAVVGMALAPGWLLASPLRRLRDLPADGLPDMGKGQPTATDTPCVTTPCRARRGRRARQAR